MNDWSFCLTAILIGLIPAAIAHSKGKDFFAWWFFGAALFIVALPASLLIKQDPDEKERRQLQAGNVRKCPYCAELIKADAAICRYCRKEVPLRLDHPLNLHQELVISEEEGMVGTEKIVEVNGNQLNVKIPAGTKDGIKLRVEKKGSSKVFNGGSIVGDLYLQVSVQASKSHLLTD